MTTSTARTNSKLSSRNIALVAVFASTYYVLSLITPYVPAIGVANLKIDLAALSASVFGLVLGPYLGALAAFLGVFISWTLPPVSLSPYSAPFILSPPLNALVVGLIYYRKWKWGFALFGLLIATFLFLPPSQPLTENYIVPVAALWDKVIALLLIIPSVVFSQRLSDPKRLPILFFFMCFVGNQVDNTWGNNVFAIPAVAEWFGVTTLSALRTAFLLSPFFYPAVRFVQAIVGMIIAVPLMRTLKNTKWIIKEKSIIEP